VTVRDDQKAEGGRITPFEHCLFVRGVPGLAARCTVPAHGIKYMHVYDSLWGRPFYPDEMIGKAFDRPTHQHCADQALVCVFNDHRVGTSLPYSRHNF